MTLPERKTEQTKAVAKKYTEEETRDMLMRFARADCDPELLVKNLARDVLPRFLGEDKVERDKARKELNAKANEITIGLGLDTHIPLAEAVGVQYRGLAIDFSRQLIQEYKCESSSEKALAQTIVNAFIGVIDYSRRMNNELGSAGQVINQNRTQYLTMLGKQIDRANRQFLNALMTLKQLKNPSLEVKVTAKTAFIANNQQVNANNPPNSTNFTSNENIEPK